MSWIQEESKLNWVQSFAVKVLKHGQIPNHVAFIMDGNRRFARKANIDKMEGHKQGFNKLSETLQWCLDIGIKECTVYAFSIENFKRSQEEVDTLMDMAREKFAKLLEERNKLHEKGVCIRIIGNLKMLPKDIQKTIAEAMLLTKDNKNVALNVAFAYTSRDEITNSMNAILEGVKNNELREEDVNDDLIEACLYTRKCSDPDLLVRTSGEVRLSDFLLWQSTSTILYFTEALWPEFTIWHLLGGVFYYQRCYYSMVKLKNHLKFRKNLENNERVKKFLDNVDKRRTDELIKMSKFVL